MIRVSAYYAMPMRGMRPRSSRLARPVTHRQSDWKSSTRPEPRTCGSRGRILDQSFRGFLAALEQRGEVQRIKRKVDPRFELASVLMLRDNGPAQIFENVAGYNMPLVAHVLNSRERLADPQAQPHAEHAVRRLKKMQNPI